jgi:pSer/pThr/pTyr-binding forkhead associated (FHA) protein
MTGQVVLHFRETDQIYQKELEIGKSIVAGRERGYDLSLTSYFHGPTERISRRHFKIHNASTGFFLIDLKSTNGTRINQEFCPPQQSFPLRNGDIIELAKYRNFQIDVSIEQDPHATAIVAEEDDTSSYHVQIIPGLGLYLDEETSIFFTTRADLPKWKLTPLENRLLKYFYQYRGRTCSYYDIASDVWDYPDMPYDSIRHTVTKLRKKFNLLSPGAGKHYLKTINGFGYKLVRQ